MEAIKRQAEKENRSVATAVGRRIKREKPLSLLASVRDLIPTSECASGLKVRKVFGDATNRVLAKAAVNFSVKESIKKKNAVNPKLLNHNVYLEDKFTVEDDGALARTSNYTTLSYVNNQSRRLFKFYCFQEDDLNVPIVAAQKTINHVSHRMTQTLDNDCSTDDGQVRGAIIKLFRNIEAGLREREGLAHNC